MPEQLKTNVLYNAKGQAVYLEDKEVADKISTEGVDNFAELIDNKVDKIEGKGLSTNDFTDAEKVKLAALGNYDDSELTAALSNKVDKVSGKGLSTEDFTTAEKQKLTTVYTSQEVDALLANKVSTSVVGEAGGVASLGNDGKVPSSQLPSSNSLELGETSGTAYEGDKGKANADAITAIKDGTTIDSFGDVETALAGKVDTETGKGLSSNDFTDALKTKLEGLSAYDDTALAGRVSDIECVIPSTATSSNKLATVADIPAQEQSPLKGKNFKLARSKYYKVENCSGELFLSNTICTFLISNQYIIFEGIGLISSNIQGREYPQLDEFAEIKAHSSVPTNTYYVHTLSGSFSNFVLTDLNTRIVDSVNEMNVVEVDAEEYNEFNGTLLSEYNLAFRTKVRNMINTETQGLAPISAIPTVYQDFTSSPDGGLISKSAIYDLLANYLQTYHTTDFTERQYNNLYYPSTSDGITLETFAQTLDSKLPTEPNENAKMFNTLLSMNGSLSYKLDSSSNVSCSSFIGATSMLEIIRLICDHFSTKSNLDLSTYTKLSSILDYEATNNYRPVLALDLNSSIASTLTDIPESISSGKFIVRAISVSNHEYSSSTTDKFKTSRTWAVLGYSTESSTLWYGYATATNISWTKINSTIPDCPTTTDGNYVLKCTVSGGVPTYTWVPET